MVIHELHCTHADQELIDPLLQPCRLLRERFSDGQDTTEALITDKPELKSSAPAFPVK